MKKLNVTMPERMKVPNSRFFKIIRNVGIFVAAAGGIIIAAPVSMQSGIIIFGG